MNQNSKITTEMKTFIGLVNNHTEWKLTENGCGGFMLEAHSPAGEHLVENIEAENPYDIVRHISQLARDFWPSVHAKETIEYMEGSWEWDHDPNPQDIVQDSYRILSMYENLAQDLDVLSEYVFFSESVEDYSSDETASLLMDFLRTTMDWELTALDRGPAFRIFTPGDDVLYIPADVSSADAIIKSFEDYARSYSPDRRLIERIQARLDGNVFIPSNEALIDDVLEVQKILDRTLMAFDLLKPIIETIKAA